MSDSSDSDTNSKKIKFYGADWCGDCFRAKKFLTEYEIEFEYIDIDAVPEAAEYVKKVNPQGFQSIPVLKFADGSVMIEPSIQELEEKFL